MDPGGPVGEGDRPYDLTVGQAVELDLFLHTVTCVHNNVRVLRRELRQAWGHALIVALLWKNSDGVISFLMFIV